MDKEFFILYFVAFDALLSGRLVPSKWNQAWRPSELYMCIEREKDNFKSREVNCLKECALALTKWRMVLLSESHWKLSRTSASLMLSKWRSFRVFRTKIDLLRFFLIESTASATYNMSQAELFLVDFDC